MVHDAWLIKVRFPFDLWEGLGLRSPLPGGLNAQPVVHVVISGVLVFVGDHHPVYGRGIVWRV